MNEQFTMDQMLSIMKNGGRSYNPVIAVLEDHNAKHIEEYMNTPGEGFGYTFLLRGKLCDVRFFERGVNKWRIRLIDNAPELQEEAMRIMVELNARKKVNK